jgi:hypothetical protein
MPAIVSGRKDHILQPKESGYRDRFGLDNITMVVKIHADIFAEKLLPVGARHPRFTGMAVEKVSWSQDDGGAFYTVTYLFVGCISGLPAPTYDLSASTASEPITTHPDFSDLAGTEESPKNGAIWDDGRFIEFGPGDLQGISSYLVPGAVWSETSYSFQRPNLRNLGTIDSPPGSPPGLPGRNWLVVGMTSKKKGAVWENTCSWKLSAENGWNETIY